MSAFDGSDLGEPLDLDPDHEARPELGVHTADVIQLRPRRSVELEGLHLSSVLRCPEGWTTLLEIGVWSTARDEDGEERLQKKVAGVPILPVALRVDGEGLVDVQIAWKTARGWARSWVPRVDAVRASKLTEQIGGLDGAPIGSENQRDVARWMLAFLEENASAFPVTGVARTLGWQSESSPVRFVANSEELEVDVGRGLKEFGHAFRREGSLEGWKKVAALVDEHPTAQLPLFASLAAPLLRALKLPSFTLDLAGRSGRGKTTSQRLAASAWGDPAEVVQAWSTTEVGVERLAGCLTGLPLILDDTKNAMEDVVPKVVYRISTGRGRVRGERTGGVQELERWETVLVSSGERSIVDFGTDGGVARRCVSVFGDAVPDSMDGESGRLVRKIDRGSHEHFGWAGPLLVQRALELGAVELTRRYDCLRGDLSYVARDAVASSRASLVGALRLAAELAIELGLVRSQPDLSLWVEWTFSKANEETDNRPLAALRELVRWAQANSDRFDGSSPTSSYNSIEGLPAGAPRQGWAGVWRPEKFLALLPSTVREVLTREGYADCASMPKLWKSAGWTDCGSGRTQKMVAWSRKLQESTGTKTSWMVVVPQTTLEGVLGVQDPTDHEV